MNLNFSISELCASSKAKQAKIDNIPSDLSIMDNMINLIVYCLQPLREDWGESIHISSGYRCPKLNKLVGGSSTSSHMEGSAVDIYVKGDMEKFFQYVREYFKHHEFDQCIKEKVGNSNWLHISYRKGNNRNMFLTTTDGKTYQHWKQ